MSLYELQAQSLIRVANHQEDPHVKLAASVILSAYLDLHSKNGASVRAAHQFFKDGWFKPWAELARLEPDVVMRGYRNECEKVESGEPLRIRLHRKE